eukprot:TRINITY_DN3355_c0_g1_i1.p1 TRINITY_DN3355_c0_g1~~TRINITY_DN3355_c0_g1_i1.p1  ORF type:complete len:411 (+),score=66.24 TRINITY_DN3355_c0_g1_i1:160-1392(+)
MCEFIYIIICLCLLMSLVQSKTYPRWVMNPYHTFYDFPDLHLANENGTFTNYPFFNQDTDGRYKLHFVYKQISYKLAGLPACFIGLLGTTTVTPFYLLDDFSTVCEGGNTFCWGPDALYADCNYKSRDHYLSKQTSASVSYLPQTINDISKSRRYMIIKGQNIWYSYDGSYYTTVGVEIFEHSYKFVSRGTVCTGAPGATRALYKVLMIYAQGFSMSYNLHAFTYAVGVEHFDNNNVRPVGFVYNSYDFWAFHQVSSQIPSLYCRYNTNSSYSLWKFVNMLKQENAKSIRIFGGDYRQVDEIDWLICFVAYPDEPNQAIKCLTWYNVYGTTDICNDNSFEDIWNLNDIVADPIEDISEIQDLRPFYLNGQWLLLKFKLMKGNVVWRIMEYARNTDILHPYLNTQSDSFTF